MPHVFRKILKQIIEFMLYVEKPGGKIDLVHLDNIGVINGELKFHSFDVVDCSPSSVRTSKSTSQDGKRRATLKKIGNIFYKILMKLFKNFNIKGELPKDVKDFMMQLSRFRS